MGDKDKSDEFVYHCLVCNMFLSEEEHKEHKCNKNRDLFMVNAIEKFKNKARSILNTLPTTTKKKLVECLNNINCGVSAIPHFKVENMRVDEHDPTKIHFDIFTSPDLINYMLDNGMIELLPTKDGYTFSTRTLREFSTEDKEEVNE